MVNVILHHEVKDFKEWLKGFQEHEAMRSSAGVKTLGVFQSIENPNHVTVSTEFPSKEAVDGFVNNPGFKEIMEKSGVIGKPEFKILNKVQMA